MFTVKFLKATAERAARTFAQTLAGVLGFGALNIFNVPWDAAVGVSLGAAFLSLLTSIAGDALTSSSGPSFTSAETTASEVVPGWATERP